MSAPILRTSERKTFADCEAKWNWAWNEGLTRRGSARTPLWFGTGIHISLACWYCGPGLKRGPHPAETWSKYAKQEIETVKVPGLSDDAEAIYVDAHELGVHMLDNYVKTYGRDEHMSIIQPEQTFDINVPWPKGRQAVYEHIEKEILTRYVGTYDLVWRSLINDMILLEEHKTAATIRTHHLSIDKQAGSYWAIATRSLQKQGLIGPKEVLRGIEYNFLRKALPDVRPTDQDGFATNNPLKKHYVSALETHWRKSKWSGEQDFQAEMKRINKMTISDLKTLAEANDLMVVGERSKRQPGPLLLREMVHRTRKERASQLRRIQDEAVKMKLIRDGLVQPIKNDSIWCSTQCDFFDLCELDERGGDTEEYKKMVFKRWDPYADHRKSTDE